MNFNIMHRYLLEPYPQQHLFSSSIPLRFASHSPDEQFVRVTVGKRTQTSRIESSSLTQLPPLPLSVCRSSGSGGAGAEVQGCSICVSWGPSAANCSFCFNFTFQAPTYSLHDTYLGCNGHNTQPPSKFHPQSPPPPPPPYPSLSSQNRFWGWNGIRRPLFLHRAQKASARLQLQVLSAVIILIMRAVR
jgi:hypothetical protein